MDSDCPRERGRCACWAPSAFLGEYAAYADLSRAPPCPPLILRQLLFPKMGTIVVMADSTLVRLGSIAERRWGLVTTAQAEDAGVSRKQLARMASAGAIERVAQGVYRMAGAPPQDHEATYATWLALGGATASRTETGVAPVVAAGVTAAVVHGIGDFFPER